MSVLVEPEHLYGNCMTIFIIGDEICGRWTGSQIHIWIGHWSRGVNVAWL